MSSEETLDVNAFCVPRDDSFTVQISQASDGTLKLLGGIFVEGRSTQTPLGIGPYFTTEIIIQVIRAQVVRATK